MATINAVLGPIDTTALGFTLMHEHIMSTGGGIYLEYPELLGPDLMKRVISALKQAKEGGVDTIVDASTFDLGRNIHLLTEASRLSGVNIIACTGWWMDIPRSFDGLSADQLAQIFIKDCEEGIAGTNIKAGILKAASDFAGVTHEQQIILRAVARAQLKTGVPVMLHSSATGRVGKQQLAILKEEGVDLKRVKLDHSNDTCDTEYLTWILEQGCYLGMDRYPGHSAGVSTHSRNKTLKELIDAGNANRLLLSHDWILTSIITETPHLAFMSELLAANPYDFLFIKKVVLPQLRDMGVPETVVNSLCIDGPRKFFEGA